MLTEGEIDKAGPAADREKEETIHSIPEQLKQRFIQAGSTEYLQSPYSQTCLTRYGGCPAYTNYGEVNRIGASVLFLQLLCHVGIAKYC